MIFLEKAVKKISTFKDRLQFITQFNDQFSSDHLPTIVTIDSHIKKAKELSVCFTLFAYLSAFFIILDPVKIMPWFSTQLTNLDLFTHYPQMNSIIASSTAVFILALLYFWAC